MHQQPTGTPENPMLRDPMQPPQPPVQPAHKHSSKKLMMFTVGGVILALIAAVAVYWFVLRDQSGKAAQQQTTNTQQTEEDSVEQPVVADSTPQTLKSETLGIELTHRKDWTLKESSDGTITITSPKISYATSGGTSKTGVFTLRVRKGATQSMQANIDKAIATRDSEVIAYAAPAEGQREYTNVSYAGPKDMFGFFVVTSNSEFKAGAPLSYALQFGADSYLIAGGYGADSTNSLAFDSVPKDMMDSEALTQAIDIVESLKIY